MAKDELLLTAVRRARDAGMTWDQFVRIVAPEWGAIFRENAIDGWRPVTKPKRWPYDSAKAQEALHGKKGKRKRWATRGTRR